MKLLILRPEPGAWETAARARALGLDCVVAPLFEVQARTWDAADASMFDAVAITSANAARYGGKELSRYKSLPLFVVGEATAEAARNAGFAEIVASDGDASTLAATLANAGVTRVLHLAGADHRALAHPALRVATRIVYASEPLPPPPLPTPAVALLHSARAAAAFAALPVPRDRIAVVAISANVAEAAEEGWRAKRIADAPTDAAMLALAARLCEMPG